MVKIRPGLIGSDRGVLFAGQLASLAGRSGNNQPVPRTASCPTRQTADLAKKSAGSGLSMRETSAAIADRQHACAGLRIARTGGSSAISWRGGLRLLDGRGGRRAFSRGGFSRRGVWFG